MIEDGFNHWFSLWSEFQFLRPGWLCLAPVFILWIGFLLSRSTFAGWGGSIDKDKLKHLQTSSGSHKRYYLFAAALLIASIALAGPSLTSMPVKAGHSSQARVFVLDLSPSMLAQDIKPDRLTIAKLKLIDMLRLQTDNQSGLVVYASDAHQVVPLIDDPRVGESLVPVLHPAIMPQSGSNTEAGIALATELIFNAGFTRGDIVLITDGVHEDAVTAIETNWQDSLRLSILAVGSSAGAPIPVTGNAAESSSVAYVRDQEQNIVIAQLNTEPLKTLAQATGGRFSEITADHTDVKLLTDLSLNRSQLNIADSHQSYDQYHDAGYWLVIALLQLVLLAFRKNVFWVWLPLMIVAPDSHADNHALGWSDLWFTKDQQAQRAWARGDYDTAASLFTDFRWRAISLYRQQEYAAVIDALSTPEYADDLFNRGNAQALAGDLEGALTSCRVALGLYRTEQDKQNTLYNISLLRHLLDTQQEQNANGSSNGTSGPVQSDAEALASTEDTTDAEQAPIGGVAGGMDTLQQQAMNEQSSGPATDRQSESEMLADANNASQRTAEQSDGELPDSDLQFEASESGGPTIAVENSNPVLSPYSEQWLRELPVDPGGYLRRKFGYQAQTRGTLDGADKSVGKVRY